jgi:hypothetical protein
LNAVEDGFKRFDGECGRGIPLLVQVKMFEHGLKHGFQRAKTALLEELSKALKRQTPWFNLGNGCALFWVMVEKEGVLLVNLVIVGVI